MNMIDNRQGFGTSLSVSTGKEYGDISIELNDNKIYGESPIPDCPEDGSYCLEYDKYGFVLVGAAHAGKPLHITMPPGLPVQKIKALSPWATIQKMHRNEFIGFNAKTSLGK